MEYRGPWPDIEIPDVSLYDLLFAHLTDEQAEQVAFDHAETGQVLTFGQVKHDVDALATWLAQRGVTTGSVVAVALANRPEYAAALHGALRTGAAVTPVNAAAHPSEVARQLALTGASVVITEQALLAGVREAVTAGDGAVTELVVVGESPDGATPWADVVTTPVALPEVTIDPPTHVACLPVSSGTSGMPKAVRLSHRNLVANMLQFSGALEYVGEHASLVAFLPYSHIYALTTNLNLGLHRCWPQYTMSSFQAHLFLEIVATRRPSMLFVVPPVAGFLARHKAIDSISWDSVRLVVSGAAALDQATGDALEQRLGTRLIQGYGMTELSPVSHVIAPERADISLGTIGQAIGNCRFRVVDPDTGADVTPPPPGEWSTPGELWVRGPNTMMGYLAEPEASDATLDADGWVHTGDLVQVDDEAVVRVVDRMKELIKRRGLQIAPAELEAHLLHHPEVADAAVVGVGADAGDQVPHALLVLNEGVDPEGAGQRVVQWLNAAVAPYKRVPRATIVDALPRSAAGKLLRRQLLPLVD